MSASNDIAPDRGKRSGPSTSVRRKTGTGLAAALVVTLGSAFVATDAAMAAPVTTPTLVQASDESSTTVDTTDTDQNIAHADTDTASNGSTVVSTFSVGRPTDGFGAASIGFSTSTDNGRTWTDGQLPFLTAQSPHPNAAYPRVVDSTVAWDAKSGTWIIPSATYVPSATPPPALVERAILVNTSSDGLAWNDAVPAVQDPTVNADKPWVVCDNTASSVNYGTCYIAFTVRNLPNPGDFSGAVTKSTDGGATWSSPVPIGSVTTPDQYNLVPVVQPDGDVVVVGTGVNGDNGATLFSSVSTDGGASFSTPTLITTIQRKNPNTTIREQNKPAVDVDAVGRVTVIWSDCRFSTGCNTNQLVMSSSADGTTFAAPAKLNIPGAVTATQFGQGLGIDPATSGSTAHLSVVYDTVVACGTSTCVNTEYATSYNGGSTWSAPYAINPTPMDISWMAANPRGRYLGDYNSVSFVQGAAVTVVPLALSAPSGGTLTQKEYGFSTPVGFNPAPPAPAPVTPDTVLTKHPKKKKTIEAKKGTAKFKFTSTVPGSTFKCKLDKKHWKACNSGKIKYKVKPGKHKFKVRATANGLTDQSPVKFKFKVIRKS